MWFERGLKFTGEYLAIEAHSTNYSPTESLI